MQLSLNPVEIRILGVLIEKQLSTPDYYPLTLNALINACNQKSSRDPVMSLNQQQVEQALDRLRKERLVWQVMIQGGRTPKYEHNLKEITDFSALETAIICELLLRGAQTVGELRSRTARLAQAHEIPAIEHALKKLAIHEHGPFVEKLERRPGQKEGRYTHLFGGNQSPLPTEIANEEGPSHLMSTTQSDEAQEGRHRFEALEERVSELQTELEALKDAFLRFKAQFE